MCEKGISDEASKILDYFSPFRGPKDTKYLQPASRASARFMNFLSILIILRPILPENNLSYFEKINILENQSILADH